MKKNRILMMAVAVAALVGLAVLKRYGQPTDLAAPPVAPVTRQAVQPVEASSAAAPDANHKISNPPVGGEPAVTATPPANRSGESIPEASGNVAALIAELRPKVNAALLASDFKAADRHVDEVLATAKLEPLEKQRLMVLKMASRGMRGDHAAMLALMDEIIAVAPDSPLSAQMSKERPQLEKIQRLGPNHPELCKTCGQMHAPGAHPADNAAKEPQD